MYQEIQAVAETIKVLSDILRANRDLCQFNECSAALSQLNEKLYRVTAAMLAGQEKEAALTKQIRLLEEEVMKLVNWNDQAQNYALTAVGPGIFAYVYQPSAGAMQPRHWVCAKCFQERKLSVLQRQHPPAYLCPQCGATIAPHRDGRLVAVEDVR